MRKTSDGVFLPNLKILFVGKAFNGVFERQIWETNKFEKAQRSLWNDCKGYSVPVMSNSENSKTAESFWNKYIFRLSINNEQIEGIFREFKYHFH